MTPPGSRCGLRPFVLLALLVVIVPVVYAGPDESTRIAGIYDAADDDDVIPSSVQLVRPVLISPIAFSTFSGAMYLQNQVIGLSLTAMLFAFQIGFMWQHVLEKKVSEGQNRSASGERRRVG